MPPLPYTSVVNSSRWSLGCPFPSLLFFRYVAGPNRLIAFQKGYGVAVACDLVFEVALRVRKVRRSHMGEFPSS